MSYNCYIVCNYCGDIITTTMETVLVTCMRCGNVVHNLSENRLDIKEAIEKIKSARINLTEIERRKNNEKEKRN